jgi:hypothetical protein
MHRARGPLADVAGKAGELTMRRDGRGMDALLKRHTSEQVLGDERTS